MPTSAAPISVTDLAMEVIEQIDDILQCERSQGEAHRAEYAAVCRRGCGMTMLICGPHLGRLRRTIIDRAADGSRFGCVDCRTACSTLDEAFRVELI